MRDHSGDHAEGHAGDHSRDHSVDHVGNHLRDYTGDNAETMQETVETTQETTTSTHHTQEVHCAGVSSNRKGDIKAKKSRLYISSTCGWTCMLGIIFYGSLL